VRYSPLTVVTEESGIRSALKTGDHRPAVFSTRTEALTRPPCGITTAVQSPLAGTRSRAGDLL